MIDIKELRVGNLLTVKGATYTVLEICQKHLTVSKNGTPMHWRHDDNHPLVGIPLTEEWLIKFGIVKFSGWVGEFREAWRKTNSYFQLERVGQDEWVFHGVEIKYVHQLQNLYRALTGDELCVK